MLQVGAIGYRGHAGSIIELVNRSGKASVTKIYHPVKTLSLPGATNRLDDLLGCDAILILSPDSTHFEYLEFFNGRCQAYIFCEKPPATTTLQLEALRSKPGDRVFFNFNLRFSRLREVIDEALRNGSLGAPIHCSVFVTHGLAFKESFASSWRAHVSERAHVIAETVAIHYVDFFGVLFGGVKNRHYKPTRASGRSDAYDTCLFFLEYESGVTASVLASYAAPLMLQITIVGTNGVIECNDDQISLYSPRDVYDDRGYFAPPPCRYRYEYSEGTLFAESLERSVDYFLTHCERQEAFPRTLYDQSLNSNELTLSLG